MSKSRFSRPIYWQLIAGALCLIAVLDARSEGQLFVASGELGVYSCKFGGGELSEARKVFSLENIGSIELGPRQGVLYASAGRTRTEVASGEVVALRVTEGGGLEELNRVRFDAERFCSLAVSPDKRFLLGASYGSGVVGSFSLGPDGEIREQVSHVRLPRLPRGNSDLARAHDVEFSHDGSLVFVPDIANDRVYTFEIGEDGKLESNGFVSSDSFRGPRHLTMTSDSSRVFVLNQIGSSVVAFRHDGNGKLVEYQSISTLPDGYEGPQNHAAEILLHPGGQFLYTSNRVHDSLSVFALEADGKLRALQRVASGGSRPWSFVLAEDGGFLICSNRKSDNLVVFRIDPEDGKIARQRGEIAVPDPVSLAIRDGAAGDSAPNENPSTQR